MLPIRDGMEVCREVRKKYEMPIIMLTAKDSEIDKVLGLELGADDYVTKPFSTRELIARVKANLRRHQQILHRQIRKRKPMKLKLVLLRFIQMRMLFQNEVKQLN